MSETTNLKLFKQDNPTTNTNNFDIEKTLNENWDKLDENAGTTNKKLESLEKVDSTTNETITAIQEEQTTQNENIEKNAEGIAQNKKDVDEELTKIKKENSLLKSQIPEGHASGNNIHLGDSSNMDFQCKLRGGSRQETRSGKNKLNFKNIDSTLAQSVTYSIKEGIITLDGTASGLLNIYSETFEVTETGQYTLSKNTGGIFDIGTGTSTPSILIQQKQTDGSFSTVQGTELSAKSTSNSITFKLEKGTYRLRIFTAAGNSLNNFSWKPQLENGIEATSYEQYGVSPSPDFPSKIENVGDNINILNKKVVDASNNLRGNALDTGRRLIANKDGTYTYGAFKLGGRELLGKTLGIHADIETTGGNPRISIFAGNSSSLTKSLLQVVLSASGTGYMTIPSNLNSELDTISAVLYVTTDASVVAGTYVDYTNLKVQVGSGKVVYSAYNCGSLGVTIGNENFGNAELLYSQMKNFSFTNVRKELVDNKNCIVFLNTQFRDAKEFKGLKFNYKKDTRYVIRGKFRIYDTSITSGSDLWIEAYDKDGKEIGHDNHQSKGSEWIQFSFLTDANSSFDHISFSYGTTAYWCLDMDSLEIYEGTSVQEVSKSQVQTIIFPFEEGQKLYEGSYLAEDGIHNKRNQITLNGTEYLGTTYGKIYNNMCLYETNVAANEINTKGKLISNLFTYSRYFNEYVGEKISIISNGNIGIALNSLKCPNYTVVECKKWLSENNVIVEYELSEEEIIPYTQEQQAVIDKILYTYKNVTNISVDNELATLDITYKKDIETMFNKQAKEYNERLSNIENLLNTTETSALLLDNLENDLKEEV